MELLRSEADLRAWRMEARGSSLRVVFVPTMGALHEGHLSLVRLARTRGDRVVVSIFVNPTQFGPNEDFDRYPRDEESDLALCRAEGVDAVFLPSVETIYPAGFATRVAVSGLGEHLCGARRPGHFDGVCTVVSRLFGLVRPDAAVFGEKDFQQLRILQRMTADLALPVEIIGAPIAREHDGLARSSRNRYLNPEERRRALGLSRGLASAQALFDGGERGAEALVGAVSSALDPADRVDYIQLVDVGGLQPIAEVSGPALLALAVFVGATRLIDNRVLQP